MENKKKKTKVNKEVKIVKKSVKKIVKKSVIKKKVAKKVVEKRTPKTVKKVVVVKKKSTKKDKVFLEEKTEKLIQRGRARGFITFSEILYFLPEFEKNIFGLEAFLEQLENTGIEIKETKNILGEPEKKSLKKLSTSRKIDPVQTYLKEVGSYSLITPDKEKDLAKKIEKEGGDPEAKKELARANLRLVVSIAKKYVGRS
ncbi:MAG: sigma-70 factor domain-containing protein, partial [Patescibacteria group bacterium]